MLCSPRRLEEALAEIEALEAVPMPEDVARRLRRLSRAGLQQIALSLGERTAEQLGRWATDAGPRLPEITELAIAELARRAELEA